MAKFFKLLMLTFFLAAPSAHALIIYNGNLTTPDGIDGSGIWNDSFKVSWLVEEQLDDSWKYTYNLTKVDGTAIVGAPSHFLIEISDTATSGDFWGFNGSQTEIKTNHGPHPSNPNIPGTFSKVLKLDYGSAVYSFFSSKDPVWGDFYSKNGTAGGKGFNAAWNADFNEPDPFQAPGNGLPSDGNGGFIYKVLRPDSTSNGGGGGTPNSPEPATVALLSLGLAAGGFRRRFIG